MPTELVTIAEMLKGAGYATGHVGKWHLGYTPETMPNGQGFDHSFGHMGGCIDNYSHFFYWAGPNRHDLWDDGTEVHHPGQFFPDLMVEQATRFIDANRDRPFFLYFAMNMPHYPYQGDPEWLEYYADLPHPRNLYAAFLSTLDERIGRLVAAVDELGLREDTLIIFQSDHGHSTEERAHFGGGVVRAVPRGEVQPVRGRHPRAGDRQPGRAAFPRARSATSSPTGATGCRRSPSIAASPRPRAIDGLSLAPVIASADAPTPHEVVHWQIGRGEGAQWAVRKGDWKLIGNPNDTGTNDLPKPGPLFLSNLARDPGEQTDYRESDPEVARELLRLHEQWLGRVEGE